jgi:hypothetical protein
MILPMSDDLGASTWGLQADPFPWQLAIDDHGAWQHSPRFVRIAFGPQ